MTTDFGLQVRSELLKRNITMKKFSEMLGISNPYLSDILRGRRDAPKQKEKIAKLLNIELED